MHLAVSPALYSLEDLVGVKNGILLDFLQEVKKQTALESDATPGGGVCVFLFVFFIVCVCECVRACVCVLCCERYVVLPKSVPHADGRGEEKPLLVLAFVAPRARSGCARQVIRGGVRCVFPKPEQQLKTVE